VPSLEDILVRHVADVGCAYVIYDRSYSASRRIILDYLASCDIASIGRYGNWEYSGMEESLRMGMEVAKPLSSPGS
jgi:hypothetical protein